MDQRRDAFSIVFDKFCAISCSYSICEHKHECQGHCEAAHMFSVWFFYSLSNACVCNIVLVLSPASEQGLYTVASLLVRHQDSQTFEYLIISKHSCPVCVCQDWFMSEMNWRRSMESLWMTRNRRKSFVFWWASFCCLSLACVWSLNFLKLLNESPRLGPIARSHHLQSCPGR